MPHAEAQSGTTLAEAIITTVLTFCSQASLQNASVGAPGPGRSVTMNARAARYPSAWYAGCTGTVRLRYRRDAIRTRVIWPVTVEIMEAQWVYENEPLHMANGVFFYSYYPDAYMYL